MPAVTVARAARPTRHLPDDRDDQPMLRTLWLVAGCARRLHSGVGPLSDSLVLVGRLLRRRGGGRGAPPPPPPRARPPAPRAPLVFSPPVHQAAFLSLL